MRSRLVRALPIEAPRVQLPVQDDETANLVRLSFTAQGSSAAAWLVKRYRRALHRDGCFAVDVPRAFLLSAKMREEKMRWFYVAVARLRRSDHWRVQRQGVNASGQVRYVIVWEARGVYRS